MKKSPLPPFRGGHCTNPSPMPLASGPIEPSTNSAIQPQMAKNIAKAFSTSRIRKRAIAKVCDGDPSLWDEWLRVQIEYYKIKTELEKEQLLQLKSRSAAE
ncbi:hypothetical protein PoB_006045900 [Plakobranchus ocellatus]|uniref:Uncharacterized protein n=1 Tax=Plakobranchus ocellatus TaxID=259542 RepID=A0AAV4CQ04_9GAST|nr:hypothetical protein PoB_006045900 [Plakobranchus ocellatus]